MTAIEPGAGYRPMTANQCEHEDWDRSIADWVRCENEAATVVGTPLGRILAVCAEDAELYP